MNNDQEYSGNDIEGAYVAVQAETLSDKVEVAVRVTMTRRDWNDFSTYSREYGHGLPTGHLYQFVLTPPSA